MVKRKAAIKWSNRDGFFFFRFQVKIRFCFTVLAVRRQYMCVSLFVSLSINLSVSLLVFQPVRPAVFAEQGHISTVRHVVAHELNIFTNLTQAVSDKSRLNISKYSFHIISLLQRWNYSTLLRFHRLQSYIFTTICNRVMCDICCVCKFATDAFIISRGGLSLGLINHRHW